MPRAVYQDAAHRFGGGAEKVLSALPLLFAGRELQVGLVHQSGRLQGMRLRFLPQAPSRQLAQFTIDERNQIRRRLSVSLARRIEDESHVINVHLHSAFSRFPKAPGNHKMTAPVAATVAANPPGRHHAARMMPFRIMPRS